MRVLKPKQINLMNRLRDNPRRDAAGRKLLQLLLPAALVACALLAFEGYFLLHHKPALQQEYEALEEYLSDGDRLYNYNRSILLTTKRQEMAGRYEMLTALYSNLDSYAVFDRALFDLLMDTAEANRIVVESVDFNRETGSVLIRCAGFERTANLIYTEALENTDRFTSARNISFSSELSTEYNDQGREERVYFFQISGTLAGRGAVS